MGEMRNAYIFARDGEGKKNHLGHPIALLGTSDVCVQ
jgi:hypothetical protein